MQKFVGLSLVAEDWVLELLVYCLGEVENLLREINFVDHSADCNSVPKVIQFLHLNLLFCAKEG